MSKNFRNNKFSKENEQKEYQAGDAVKERPPSGRHLVVNQIHVDMAMLRQHPAAGQQRRHPKQVQAEIKSPYGRIF